MRENWLIFLVLFLASFALGLDAYVLAGILPLIANSLHTSVSNAGLGIAVFTATYAIFSPIFSAFISRFHIPTGLWVGLITFVVGNIATIYANSLIIFLVARVIAGTGAGIFSPLASATAASLVAKTQKGRALAIILAGLSIGTAFGVPLGMWIASSFNWHFTIGFIVLLGMMACLGIMLTSKKLAYRISTTSFSQKLASLKNRKVQYILAVTFLVGFSSLGMYSFLSEFLKVKGFLSQMSLVMWLWGIGGMVGAFSIGYVIDKWLSPFKATSILIVLLMIGLTLLNIGYVGALIGCFIWGYAGWSSLTPQQHRLINLPNEDATNTIAMNASANYLGGAVGTFFCSMLLTSLGVNSIIICCLIVLGLALIVHVSQAKFLVSNKIE